MTVFYRLHEWLAERCRWVQYPRPRYVRPQLMGAEDWIDKLFKWGLFGWLMALIWVPVIIAIVVILMAVFGHYPSESGS